MSRVDIQESLLKLFSEAGYTCKAVHINEHTIENRRKGLLMDRRWIQAVFVYTDRALPAGTAAGTISSRPLGVLQDHLGMFIMHLSPGGASVNRHSTTC